MEDQITTSLTDLGGVASFIVIILYLIFDFIKKQSVSKSTSSSVTPKPQPSKNEGDSGNAVSPLLANKNHEMLLELKTRIGVLYDWHNKEDQDGIKIWYNKRSLEEAVNRLVENVATQNELSKQQMDVMSNQSKLLEEIAMTLSKQPIDNH